jgi:hypothetical protein
MKGIILFLFTIPINTYIFQSTPTMTFSDSNSKYDDVEVYVKQRKTISDVMTVWMSIQSGKSSKNHKLKPRSTGKPDRTRSKENRTRSIEKRNVDHRS